MLRESSQTQHLADNLDLTAVTDASKDSGVAHGELLIRFAEAVLGNNEIGLETARDIVRQEILTELGPEALVDAAGVVATFMQMVRIADSTGIAVVGPMLEKSSDFRTELGLNAYGSAQNTLGRTAA